MADSQVPWGLPALNGVVTTPAWKSKPSWYLAPSDKMIPPPAQRSMSKRAGATSQGKVAGADGAAAQLGILAPTLESKIRQLKIEKGRYTRYSR